MQPMTDLEIRGILERLEGRITDLEALNVPSFNQDIEPLREQPKVEVERIHRYINVYPEKKKGYKYE